MLLLLMVCFWGANLAVIKVALQHFDPLAFNCVRFILASLAMMILYRKIFRDRIDRKDLLKMLGLGVLGNTIYQLFFIHGVAFSNVSHVAILLGVTPIFTASISTFLGIERVSKLLWLGILLSFSGVVLIVFGGGGFDRGNWQIILGDAFVFLASVAWAVYTTFSQDLIRRYSSQHYILYTMLFGTLFLIPVSARALIQQKWHVLGPYDWIALMYSSMFALVFGYSAWYYGVQRIGSTRTSVYSNLTPVAGLMVGMLFMHDKLASLQWMGVAVIFFGLTLNRITQLRLLQPE